VAIPRKPTKYHQISIFGHGVLVLSPDDRKALKDGGPCPTCAVPDSTKTEPAITPLRCKCCNTLFVFLTVRADEDPLDGRRGFHRRS
jgi:hypothetical protein